MKKTLLRVLLVLIIVSMASLSSFASGDVIEFDKASGTVTVNYSTNNLKDYKVIVKKGDEKYTYNLFSKSEVLPLQMGNGTYAVAIYKRVEGNQYRLVTKKQANIKLSEENENKVYLANVQNVGWKKDSSTVELAKDLTKDVKTDIEKLEILHEYLIDNVKYDYDKAASVGTYYNPDSELTLEESKGICYDYASTLGVMLRSLDIPTKLVKGQSDFVRVYHAWNEVFIDEEWVVVDATVDTSLKEEGFEYSMIKDPTDYHNEKTY